jgi:hypothetical protein
MKWENISAVVGAIYEEDEIQAEDNQSLQTDHLSLK